MPRDRIIAVLAVSLCSAPSVVQAQRVIRFNRDIRPILSDKCYGCHGADAVTKKIPLRLDSEAAARSVVENGARSKLLERITSENKAVRMPPVYSGMSLSAAEI